MSNMTSGAATTRQEVEQLRERIIQVFKQRMKALESDLGQALRALDVVMHTLQDEERASLSYFIPNAPEPMTLTSAVRLVISRHSGPLDINVVRQIIEAQYPGVKRPLNPTSISNTLKRLHREGYLTLKSKGRGKIPAEYEPTKKAREDKISKEEDFDSLPRPE